MTIVREKARQQNLSLHTDFEKAVIEMQPIVADQRKIKQIMYNLLSNAVKFTPDGGSITVGVCTDSARLIINVIDTGIGIPLEQQNRIFGAFEQVDSSYTRQQQGTGLGLTLTRRIVQLHGGEIWLSSAPGKGSIFSFSLPIHQEENQTEM
jgi:signal transduction histidine kinase